MPLRDHCRSPVNDKHSWDELHIRFWHFSRTDAAGLVHCVVTAEDHLTGGA